MNPSVVKSGLHVFTKYVRPKIIATLVSDALPFGRLCLLKSQGLSATLSTKAVHVML
jgi:hypothetical protein